MQIEHVRGWFNDEQWHVSIDVQAFLIDNNRQVTPSLLQGIRNDDVS